MHIQAPVLRHRGLWRSLKLLSSNMILALFKDIINSLRINEEYSIIDVLDVWNSILRNGLGCRAGIRKRILNEIRLERVKKWLRPFI